MEEEACPGDASHASSLIFLREDDTKNRALSQRAHAHKHEEEGKKKWTSVAWQVIIAQVAKQERDNEEASKEGQLVPVRRHTRARRLCSLYDIDFAYRSLLCWRLPIYSSKSFVLYIGTVCFTDLKEGHYAIVVSNFKIQVVMLEWYKLDSRCDVG